MLVNPTALPMMRAVCSPLTMIGGNFVVFHIGLQQDIDRVAAAEPRQPGAFFMFMIPSALRVVTWRKGKGGLPLTA